MWQGEGEGYRRFEGRSLQILAKKNSVENVFFRLEAFGLRLRSEAILKVSRVWAS